MWEARKYIILHARTYWLLQEIYQRICLDYNTNGEFAEEGLPV
jgi:hypothetical protein